MTFLSKPSKGLGVLYPSVSTSKGLHAESQFTTLEVTTMYQLYPYSYSLYINQERNHSHSKIEEGKPNLTLKDRQAIHFVEQGLSNKEIAVELGVSVRSVSKRFERIYNKLGVSSRSEALQRVKELNAGVICRLWARLNSRDLIGYGELLHEDFVWESDTFRKPRRGRIAAKLLEESIWASFPDLQYLVDQIIPQGDCVVVRYRAIGTHTGSGFRNVPPTNQRAEIQACSIFLIGGWKVWRRWSYWDELALLVQLGAVL